MIFVLQNCSLVMQRKLPNSCLLPTICLLGKTDGEDPQHLFFTCTYSVKLLEKTLSIFHVAWVCGDDSSLNVQQLLLGHFLKKKPRLLWENMVKALLADLWFERTKKPFMIKMGWLDQFEQQLGTLPARNLKTTAFRSFV